MSGKDSNELETPGETELAEVIPAVDGNGEGNRTTDQADEAEQFAFAIMQRAASLTSVKIDRRVFLRTELKKHCPEIDADLAVETTPIEAGVDPRDLDEIALAAVDFEATKCAGLSFLAGIPGGIAMVGTVPADLAQYFAHVMRVEQKLAYLYGWQSFLNDDDEVDDETLALLIVLMGVMLGVGGAANTITKFAAETAQKSVAKHIERQALTKMFFYNPMKKVLRLVGVNLTKQAFAKGVSKVVPVIGGAISGGMTYVSFKQGAERLRRYLRSLPLSGIDESAHHDVEVLRAEMRERERAERIMAGGAEIAQTIGDTVAQGAAAVGAQAQGVADAAGAAAGSALQTAGDVIGGVFKKFTPGARDADTTSRDHA